jgi:hypothetical protein
VLISAQWVKSEAKCKNIVYMHKIQFQVFPDIKCSNRFNSVVYLLMHCSILHLPAGVTHEYFWHKLYTKVYICICKYIGWLNISKCVKVIILIFFINRLSSLDCSQILWTNYMTKIRWNFFISTTVICILWVVIEI